MQYRGMPDLPSWLLAQIRLISEIAAQKAPLRAGLIKELTRRVGATNPRPAHRAFPALCYGRRSVIRASLVRFRMWVGRLFPRARPRERSPGFCPLPKD